MKNVKIILLAITAFLIMGMENANAQGNTVIIKTYELAGSFSKSKMIVTNPSGTSETTNLKTLNWGKLEDVAASNTEALQAEIHKWTSEGYTIDGLTSGGLGDNFMITTVILSKKE